MERSLARNWWMVALRGVLAIAFGVLVFFWPTLAWVVIIGLFAGYAFLDGIFALWAAFSGHARGRYWWSLALEGVVKLAVGVLALAWPGITGLVLLYFIAFWAVVTGVLEIAAAIRLRKEIEGEWLLGLAGFVSIAFGIAAVLIPAAGALAIAWLIGAYAIIFGMLMLAVAFELRTAHRATAAGAPTAA